MSLIYEPNGKAREYSPLALNVYTGGCEHACNYCYCRSIGRWESVAKPRNLHGLEREAKSADRQVLLSFMADPYAPCERVHRNTRKALSILRAESCSVAVLTKGGTRCLDDKSIFMGWPDGRVKIGATLTFMDSARSSTVEPGAALPADRLEALRALHGLGVKTWVSIEPVIDPAESLALIRASIDFVDAYKVGKLNHARTTTDWKKFGTEAVAILRDAQKVFYVKNDLRAQMPDFCFAPEEADCETVFLPDRPTVEELF